MKLQEFEGVVESVEKIKLTDLILNFNTSLRYFGIDVRNV